MILMIGRSDKATYQSAKTYFALLQKLKADVELVEFDGAHSLDFESLNEALKKQGF
jgi:predicted esterase